MSEKKDDFADDLDLKADLALARALDLAEPLDIFGNVAVDNEETIIDRLDLKYSKEEDLFEENILTITERILEEGFVSRLNPNIKILAGLILKGNIYSIEVLSKPEGTYKLFINLMSKVAQNWEQKTILEILLSDNKIIKDLNGKNIRRKIPLTEFAAILAETDLVLLKEFTEFYVDNQYENSISATVNPDLMLLREYYSNAANPIVSAWQTGFANLTPDESDKGLN